MTRAAILRALIASTAAVAIVASAASAPASDTGRIAGTVNLGSLKLKPAFDPYPGRAGGHCEGMEASEQANPEEVVVYVDRVSGTYSRRSKRSSLLQQGMRFVPRVLPILAGEAVDFPNRDPYYHNVFSYSDTRRFDLGKYAEGGSRRVEFPEVGEVRVFCDIHADMNAVILVLQNPYFAQPDSLGRFVIDPIPAGTHALVAWHPDFEVKRIEVVVPSERAEALEVTF